MKIILTGATGTVGSATLRHLLATPEITSIIVLSRRQLPVTHSKLRTMIKTDYSTYDETLLKELEGAEGCVWSLGAPTSPTEVQIQWSWAAVKAFSEHLAPKLPSGKVFRFVYVSGRLVEPDQSKGLWFLAAARKERGTLETEIKTYKPEAAAKKWESFIARPACVVPDRKSWMQGFVELVAPTHGMIRDFELGAALGDLASKGGKERYLHNAMLKVRGWEVLAAVEISAQRNIEGEGE